MNAHHAIRLPRMLATLSGLVALAIPSRPASAEDVIQPATATAPLGDAGSHPPLIGPASTTVVAFTQRETRVGDRAVQLVGLQFDVTTKITQSGQVAHESSNTIRRQQQRTIDVLEVAEGRATKARASFEFSRRQTPESEQPNELAPLPVEGKAYLVARVGEELRVTDLEGAIPPLEEYTIAAESLGGIGKPNPLALMLAGRQVAIGQRLFVPRDMAQSLLGLGTPELAMVNRFEVTLVRVELPAQPDRLPLAIFQAQIEVKPDDDNAMAVNLNGEMAIEPETCRLASVDIAGPVRVSTVERTAGGTYQYSMNGLLRLAIRSSFGSAAR